MTPSEHQLMASYATAFRHMAERGSVEDRERRLLTAKSFERALSHDLLAESSSGDRAATHAQGALVPPLAPPGGAPSEDTPPELTREQWARVDELATDHDEVRVDRRMDGRARLSCFDYTDYGDPYLAYEEWVSPDGVVC